MRPTFLAAVATLALVAAGCAPRPDAAARVRLDCPHRQGELVRVSATPDGKTCAYRAGGVDVDLRLLPVSGDALTTLNGVETSLLGGTASAASGEPANVGSPPAQAPQPQGADAAAGTSSAAAEAARQAAADAGGPGADDASAWSQDEGRGAVVADGDNAHINLPGLHIDTHGDQAKVDIAGIHIDASQDEATVRVMRDVRLLGHPFSRHKNGIRATFIAKRDNLPNGFRFVAYEASGPKTGPLAVAEVRSREEIDGGDRLYHDIQRLVRRNGGA